MKIHTIKPTRGSVKRAKRIGRGKTRGNFSGKGVKGQNARTGGGVRPGFEGGQTPLSRRMPKLKGFKNINKVSFTAVNLNQLERFEEGSTVDAKMLKIKTNIKILGMGSLTKKLKVIADAASESAIKKLEKAGAELILPKKNA
mgnify:CR=1 FL=1